MIIREVFENCFIEFGNEMGGFWNSDLMESHQDFIEAYETQLELSSRVGNDAFQDTGKKFLEDILSGKTKVSEEELPLLHFLQFYSCGLIAQHLSSNGIFTQTHDWLVWSMSDEIEYGSEVTFLLERLDLFQISGIHFIRRNLPDAYVVWMSTLFYYSRHLGGLKELAGDILDQEYIRFINLSRAIGLDYNEGEVLNLLCQVLAWCITNKKDDYGNIFANTILEFTPKLEPSNKKSAYLQLATGGAQYTGLAPEFYAKKVITDYKHLCSHHEQLHAQSIYYTYHIEDLEADPTLLQESFDVYAANLSGTTVISKIYEKGRIFGIIRGLIMSCLEKGKVALAFNLIARFYEKGDDYTNQLFIALNISKQNVSFVSEGKITSGDGLSIDAYRNLVTTENKFYGTKMSLRDDPTFVIEEPMNLGLPDKDMGIDFETCLLEYYCFQKLKESEINFDSLLIIPGPQHPIQSLMIKEIGYSAPINSSLKIPDAQRKITKILLWCFGTLSSDRELDMVSQIFDKNGIEVEVVDILVETKETFIRKYADPSYDVIWIGTHGNYDHIVPHKSTLGILPDVDISIEDLSLINLSHEGQRLLFLNVCDGATSSSNDSMYEHGFGAGLACKSQCVISHLWPVETEPALFYGIVYADLLCSIPDFWKAYELCIKLLSSDGNGLLYSLKDRYAEIDFSEIERRLTEQINANIYYWGSSVFYV